MPFYRSAKKGLGEGKIDDFSIKEVKEFLELDKANIKGEPINCFCVRPDDWRALI